MHIVLVDAASRKLLNLSGWHCRVRAGAVIARRVRAVASHKVVARIKIKHAPVDIAHRERGAGIVRIEVQLEGGF